MSRELWNVCEGDYFPRRLRLRSGKTRKAYRYAINSFAECLGRPATLADLDDDAVTVWLGRLLDSGLSVYTVREKVRRVLALWRWCACRRIVNNFPTVQCPEPPELNPTAFAQEQLSALFEASRRENGTIAGIPAWDWWPAYLQFLWNSAERRSAALAVRYEWVDLKRKVVTIPGTVRKGGRKTAVIHLWDRTVDLMLAIAQPARENFFPWDKSEGAYYYQFGRICKRAGLPDDRWHKSHAIRRTHATHRYLAGHDASKAMLHDSPEVTRRHYIDKSFLTPDPPLFDPWRREAS